MVSLRPTIAADIEQVYGRPLGVTVQGITAEENGRVLGIGAIYPSDGCMVLICGIAEGVRPLARRHAKAMVQGARQLLAIAAKTNLPVRTVADRRIPKSIDLIEHLGFRHIEKDVYEWATQA